MGAPYSLDLRERVVAAVGSGMSRRAAAKHYQVGVATAIRWTARAKRTGSPAALPMGGKKPFTLAHEEASIRVRVAEKPDITGRELLADLNQRGIEVSHDGVWHFLDQVGRSFKKACTPANRIALTSHGGASNGSDTRTRSPPDG